MIVEYVRYSIAPEAAPEFRAAYGRAAESLRASPECLGFELAVCVEAPEAYVLRILWTSMEGHLEGFRKSSEFGSFLREIGPFRDRIEEMRHYEQTDVCWQRGG
jgi:quinol monooxygenase YgiN